MTGSAIIQYNCQLLRILFFSSPGALFDPLASIMDSSSMVIRTAFTGCRDKLIRRLFFLTAYSEKRSESVFPILSILQILFAVFGVVCLLINGKHALQAGIVQFT